MAYLRPKTRRRLLTLAVVAFLISGGAWVAVRVGQRRSAAALAVLRQKAMADYAAGNLPAALKELGDYLALGKQQDTDANALLAYGMCRGSVETPGHRNLIEAVGILAHYLQIRPDDRDSAHTLLEWYGRVRYDAEALALSESLLSATPMDLDARLAKVKALWGMSRLPQALSESDRLNHDAPTFVKGQLLTLYLLMAMDRGDEAVGRAGKWCVAHPNDARFEMLRGAACLLTGNDAQARQWLAKAAARDTRDSEFALQECRFLDSAGLFEDARDLLRRTASAGSATNQLIDQLLRRVYQDQGATALADTLSALPGSVRQSSAALGLKSAANVESDPSDLATIRQDIDALRLRSSDSVAQAWAVVLAARVGKGGDPVAEASAYREALRQDPSNAIAADWLAHAEVQMGERELALALWRRVAGACPNWARPCEEMADVLESLGRPTAALDAAKAAAFRAPESFESQLTLAGAMVALMPVEGSATNGDAALAQVRQMMTRWPGRTEALPLYAAVLARADRKGAAAQVIERSLKSDLPPMVMLGFANVNEQAGLSLDGLIESAWEKHGGATPMAELAAARLGPTRDADSLPAWEKQGDDHPADVRIQFALSQSPLRFGDHAFWKRTIDRLHGLVGEEGLVWRTETARWILTGPADGPDKDKQLAEAVTILQQVCRVAPDSADNRHLLGLALEKSGNLPGAIDALTAAAELAPADYSIVGDLAQVLRDTGRGDEASAVVHRLAQSPMLSPEARRWADEAMASDRLHSAIAAMNLPEIEADCRQILAQGPSPDACNDLAYALLLGGQPGDRPEALRLAKEAVSLSPGRAEYRDTLERITSATQAATKFAANP